MRDDRCALSPVVAVMLLLLITVILAASVYLISTNIVQDIHTRPYVALSLQHLNTTAAEIQIADVSQPNLDLANFRSVLLIDGTPDHSNDITPLSSGTVGNVTFFSTDNVLNAGDVFTVRIVSGHGYSLLILWSNGGDQVGSRDWRV